MVKIKGIERGSIADSLEIEKGDKIISINGITINDYIDFQYQTDNLFLNILLEKKDGQTWELEIERDYDQRWGIIPEGIIYDQLKPCQNNCIFCFVKQQPAGMRQTLLLKDDDYRFSFLQGSFITLTNLTEIEFERIIRLRLSPLNISIHTTNPQLRIEMMKNRKAGQILEQLYRLKENHIQFNAQIVLCPGINDGPELERTISDLDELYPNILSLGIVPVGLTAYRNNLPQLENYQENQARTVLKQIKGWQKYLKTKRSQNYLYAADEFYLLTGEEIPHDSDYNHYPQIENGIGLTRLLWNELKGFENKIPLSVDSVNSNLAIVTGELGKKALQVVSERFGQIKNLKLQIIAINNTFFGKSVTVTGLLTGQDIIKGLKSIRDLPQNIIIPAITLNESGCFLDNLCIEDLHENLPGKNFYICQNIEEVIGVIKGDKTGSCNCR